MMLEVFTVGTSDINLNDTCGFSAERLQTISKMKNETAKKLSAAAEKALIAAVRHFYPHEPLPIEYKRGEHGKPYLCTHQELFINISHSGDYAVCAASDYPIGIDLQQIRRVDFKICDKYFTCDEREYAGNDSRRFFEIWAKKESRIKATGTGMTIPLNSFSVLKNDDKFKYIELSPPQDGYVMWVCVLIDNA